MKKYKFLIISIFIFISVLVIAIGVFVTVSPKPDNDDPQAIINLVGKHYLLPTDERPTIATVEDKSKITSDFFRNAENGDKLLVYQAAKKVLLYRPSIDKLIEVGPVSIASELNN